MLVFTRLLLDEISPPYRITILLIDDVKSLTLYCTFLPPAHAPSPPHPLFLLMFMVQNFMQIRNYIRTWSEKQQKSGH